MSAPPQKPPHQERGIRIRGLPEPADVQSQSERLERDKSAVDALLKHINVTCQVTDVRRLGKSNDTPNKPRPLVFSVQNPWDKRLIFASLGKLKSYGTKLFVSNELTFEESKMEQVALKRRKELIEAGTDKKLLRIRNLHLEQKIDDTWHQI